MNKVNLTGVLTGSFEYFFVHFLDLIKVTLLPILALIIWLSISTYFNLKELESIVDGAFDFTPHWVTFFFSLLADLTMVWFFVRVTNFVFDDGAETFEFRVSEIKSVVFVIVYSLFAFIPIVLLWVVVFFVLTLTTGSHFSGWTAIPMFLVFLALLSFYLMYVARLCVSSIPVARGERPNLLSEFFRASEGNNWGLMGRFLAMAILMLIMEAVLLLMFYLFYGSKFAALAKAKSLIEISTFQLDLYYSIWPAYIVGGLVVWAVLLLQSVFVSRMAQRFPGIS